MRHLAYKLMFGPDWKAKRSEFSQLRGPEAMHFISCDACSDSTAELVGTSFCGGGGVYIFCWGGIAQLLRKLCKMGYPTDVPV